MSSLQQDVLDGSSKICTKCRVLKNLENFVRVDKPNKRASWCVSCVASQQRERGPVYRARVSEIRKRDPLRFRRYMLKNRFGITYEQWLEIFEAQGRCCKVCGSSEPGTKKGWHTDHDHVTGRMRGILCHSCNILLGLAKDDICRLEKAIIYLKTVG